MSSLLALSYTDIRHMLDAQQMPSYYAKSLMTWIYQRSVFDFQNMTDLPKDLRASLKERFHTVSLTHVTQQADRDGESIKFLFRTHDDLEIESVLILSPTKEASVPRTRTVCVSSQVGCKLACVFCATGLLGYKRNLSKDEIISQVLLIDSYLKQHYSLDARKRAVTNVVFMGMGEPFHNLDQVMDAIHILNYEAGFHLGIRQFTVSTAGVLKAMRVFTQANTQVRLAISLHATKDETRRQLMPIAQSYSVQDLYDHILAYQKQTHRQVTLEYILLRNVNIDSEHALSLAQFTQGLHVHLNLIPYNPIDGSDLERPSETEIRAFEDILRKKRVSFTRRNTKGQEIAGACGQLGLSAIRAGKTFSKKTPLETPMKPLRDTHRTNHQPKPRKEIPR